MWDTKMLLVQEDFLNVVFWLISAATKEAWAHPSICGPAVLECCLESEAFQTLL